MRLRLFGASLAIAGLLSGAGGAQATPIGQALPQVPSPRLVSAKIFLSDSPRLFWELPLAPVIAESVISGFGKPLDSGNLDLQFPADSPFPSPVSLTLTDTDVTIALEAVADPRDLQQGGH